MQKFPLSVLLSHLTKMGKECDGHFYLIFFFWLFLLSVVILYSIVWSTVEKGIFSGMTL